MQEQNEIVKIYQNNNEEAYDTENIIEDQKKEKQKINYYDVTIYALIQYIKSNEKNPSEKKWDKIAIENQYLSSKTIGYISGIGFNKFCRNIRKQINKDKRQPNF